MFSMSSGLDWEDTVSAIDGVVTPDMNCMLTSPFTAMEVQQVAFQMHPSKAPGPDGMSSFFFKKYWHIVGQDVVTAVLSVLNLGFLLRKVNHSHIVLVPKRKNPQRMSDYRPIRLSNVVYKILSKVLANRMKRVLPWITSESQSAFVPRRQITDNINVAFELMHGLRNWRRGKLCQMAIKLDMSKVYDRVEWGFLERVMVRMGFERRWINLMMMCVRTTSYSVLLNRKPIGYIKPSRGIREGDPLSPYLFLLCAEGLSALLRKAERDRKISGVSVCRGGPKISHLLFFDDSLLFCCVSSAKCHRLMKVLAMYERASGQMVNKEKTALFFSKNTPEQV
jgi:hypothetical protein